MMGFEEGMIESGYSDEESYLEYLLGKYDEEQGRGDLPYKVDERGDDISYAAWQEYLNLVRNNPIYAEAKSLWDNKWLRPKLSFYRIPNRFPEKCPHASYFAKIKNSEDTLYGYSDDVGNVIIPCVYEAIELVQQGIAIVQSGGDCYCINIDGEQITPIFECQVRWVTRGNRQITGVHMEEEAEIEWVSSQAGCPGHGRHTLINRQGLMVRTGAGSLWSTREEWKQLPAKYNFADRFYSDLIPIILVRSGGKWGGLDRQLKEIIPCDYDSYWYDNERHCIALVKEGELSLFDLNSQIHKSSSRLISPE